MNWLLIGVGVVAAYMFLRPKSDSGGSATPGQSWNVRRNVWGKVSPVPHTVSEFSALSDDNFTGNFPGNPLEIILEHVGTSEASPVMAAGQRAVPGTNHVLATIHYEPVAGDSYTAYPKLDWMPPEGTIVELAPRDVNFLRTKDGTILH